MYAVNPVDFDFHLYHTGKSTMLAIGGHYILSKSLRKIYGESPESFVAYILLRQLGLRDINVIRRFFHREKLFGWTLMEMSYIPEQSRLSRGRYLYQECLDWLEIFCHWYLRYRPETALANCLRPLAVADEWNQDAIDILRMFTGSNKLWSSKSSGCIIFVGFSSTGFTSV